MHIHHKLTVLTVSIAAALGLTAVALPGVAAAKTFEVKETGGTGAAVRTAPPPHIPVKVSLPPPPLLRTFGCGSRPTIDTSSARGQINRPNFFVPTVYMFTGPDNGCSHAYDYPIDDYPVIIWCGCFNHNPRANDLGWWDYLYLYNTDKHGWVKDQCVGWKFLPGAHGTTCR